MVHHIHVTPYEAYEAVLTAVSAVWCLLCDVLSGQRTQCNNVTWATKASCLSSKAWYLPSQARVTSCVTTFNHDRLLIVPMSPCHHVACFACYQPILSQGLDMPNSLCHNFSKQCIVRTEILCGQTNSSLCQSVTKLPCFHVNLQAGSKTAFGHLSDWQAELFGRSKWCQAL